MLIANDITVQLGHRTILSNVNFNAQPGTVTAIVGPNGSGKTTLLRALSGDVDYSGQVLLNGCDTRQLKSWELAAERAVLPQASTLAFPFTVIEVVRIGLQSGTSGETDSVAMQALNLVGLPHYANRFFQELSGGEQQRVQLARVLAQVWDPVLDGTPRWLLLDEPVASLDIGHQLQIMDIARNFAHAGGGVITVMHDLNLTALYADSVAVLAHGSVLAHDSPMQVMTDAILSKAYECSVKVNTPPPSGFTYLLPHSAGLATVSQDSL
ncbi:heme ABC transporter ATP-binding protein [Parasulfitobacter algicola]|uniref:Heme ABC transporter ATP-binding protein n=1 Tax=Parasulfitobacter algicola TaxID=2614809 RepID=A0ABX2IYH3_9RHOB|nr:heme ABC transporter ATP-binding protein [Sulfitobacter algicola]NSX56212.1 heme ABC transporter ATP-binding protein [Sulfitobacter algicola]